TQGRLKAGVPTGQQAACLLLLAVACAVCCCPTVALSAEREVITTTVDTIQRLTLDFDVTGTRVANKGIVRVEQLGEGQIGIIALKAGSTDVQFVGEGGMTRVYEVRVSASSGALKDELGRFIEEVPVDLYDINGRVFIKGEVSSVAHWELLTKAVKAYGKEVVNLASFRPAPERVIELQNALQHAGFVVETGQGGGQLGKPGVLRLDVAGSNMYVSGSVYSQGELEQVRSVVKGQGWLRLGDDGSQAQDVTGRMQAFVSVSLVPTMLELDVVFVVIRENDEKQIGANLLNAGLLTINTAMSYLGNIGSGHTADFNGNFLVNTTIAGTLEFMQAGGPGRTYSAGHMTFKNYAQEWRTFHSGGTLKVRVGNRDAVDLKDIDYGLIMKAKGGLQDARTAELDVDLELSFPVPSGNDYDLKRNQINSSVICPIGKTLVMGGMDQLMEGATSEGTPVLKNVPVLKWFFSKEKQEEQRNKLLILLSPQLAGAPVASTPISNDTKGLRP
ncbi:MAG: hypothetical protein HON70_02880, partial [Lentisphaerae bacterium]|nr:hypothetical protein [Lentisphaerota bacterium]